MTTRTRIRALALVLLAGCHVPASHAVLIDVFAAANSISGGAGQGTGLVLSAGESFSVTVDPTDLWSAGALPRWSNADGLIGDLFATGSDESGQPVGTRIGQAFGNHSALGLSLPFGSLVGSIAGNFFLVGTSFSGNAAAAGELLLWYWDSNRADNTDFVTADVHGALTGVPEPTSLALLAGGIACAAAARRRRRA